MKFAVKVADGQGGHKLVHKVGTVKKVESSRRAKQRGFKTSRSGRVFHIEADGEPDKLYEKQASSVKKISDVKEVERYKAA